MAAHLHLFRRCVSNRLQKVCPPGPADKTSKKSVHIEQILWDQSEQILWDQSSLLRCVFLTLSVTRPCRNGTIAMSSPHTPKQNHLLAALPEADYARLVPDLELIPMPLGCAVYESGGRMSYLYFPTTSIVSLLYVMESGASAEIAVTGNEGLVGISLFMGGESTPSRAVVQSGGNGYRLNATALKREFSTGGHLQHLALRYTQALITQMAQTAVCNRHHSVDQKLCRWLLLSLDRMENSELVMTQ